MADKTTKINNSKKSMSLTKPRTKPVVMSLEEKEKILMTMRRKKRIEAWLRMTSKESDVCVFYVFFVTDYINYCFSRM